MNIAVDLAPIDEKSLIRNMLELYVYDFSEFESYDLNEHGLYGYRYLDHYWAEQGRFPFIVRVDGKLAGFALVRQIEQDGRLETGFGEFFIMRKYRGQGVGEDVARQVFARFPGPWMLSEIASNTGAQRFWRTILGRLVNGEYTEQVEQGSGKIIQRFVVNPPAVPPNG